MRFPFGSDVLDTACRLLVPFMLLFAVYVVVHGHDSPGGGFQGGVICAAALILIQLVEGNAVSWGLSQTWALTVACAGVGIFAGIGLLSVVFGGNYLDYSQLPLDIEPAEVRAMGILGIEIGVALGVTGVLVLIFDALAAGGPQES